MGGRPPVLASPLDVLDLAARGIKFDGSDEGAAVNGLIAASAPGTTIRFKRGTTLGTNVQILRYGDRSYDFGDASRGASCCTIKALSNFMAPPAVWPAGGVTGVFVEETIVNNAVADSPVSSSRPGRIRGLRIDGNRQFINAGRCVDRVGTTTNGSPTVTLATTAAVVVGSSAVQAIVADMPVSGPGIPPGTLVDTVSAAQVTLKASNGSPVNATTTATNLLIFGKAVAGALLNAYWLDLDDAYVSATTGPGIMFTDRTADGTTTVFAVTPAGSEMRLGKIRTSGTDCSAVMQRTTTANNLLDGHADDFFISNCSGYAAVYMDDATGWQLDKIHGYGVMRNGVVAKNGYAHQLGDVYLENFGQEGVAGQTYRGVWCLMSGGRPLDYSALNINSTEAGGSASYNYCQIDTSANQGTIHVDVHGLGGVYEGGGTSRGIGLLLNPSSATRLMVNGTIPRFRNIAKDVATSGAGDVLFAGALALLDLRKFEPVPYVQAAATITLPRGQVVGQTFRPLHTQSWASLALAMPGSGALASGATHAYLLLYLLDSAGLGTLVARSADDPTLFTIAAKFDKRAAAFDGAGAAITSVRLEGGRRYALCGLTVGGTTDPLLKGVSWTSSTHAADLSTGVQSAAGQTDFAASLALGTVATVAPYAVVVA
jgi:hypothetical protein